MREGFLLYKDAFLFTYAASIAATWIWAPAIFVSSGNAYFMGLWGFLFFWVPNVLTLVLFGFVADKVRRMKSGVTITDAIERSSSRQKRLHLMVSIILLCCSSSVQMLGLYTLFSAYLPISKFWTAVAVSALALLTVGRGGLKYSIITDAWKWVVMFAAGLILLGSSIDTSNFSTVGFKSELTISDIFFSFGLPTIIGLLSAPYADQTFWQRVYSIKPEMIRKSFFLSALLFGLVPLIFGLIGFFQPRTNPSWSLGYLFSGGALMLVLMFCVVAALLSTLDSNLCAISAITIHDFHGNVSWGILSMVGVLIFGILLITFTDVTITGLFLGYGTLRTCIAVPSLLIIFGKYSEKRLFWSTLAAVIISSVGYMIAPAGYKFWFTVLALLLPFLGYSDTQNP